MVMMMLQILFQTVTRRAAVLGLAAVLAVALTAPTPSRAADLAAPQGEVMLTVGGTISHTNAGGEMQLDMALLEALPQHEFATRTIWTEGSVTFRGILLRDLLEVAGASGTQLRLTALNDYQITMPVSDVAGDGPLLAYMMNGAPMSVREKGPVWLVYPYDAKADYRTEQVYSRSVWQLARIEVTD
jgi:hypothetical protein